MLKRLHAIVAILVTLSMVAVPLVSMDVSAQPAVEAETGNQVINVGEQADTAPQTVQPRFAPPTGQDPLPQTQEPVSDPFVLDSVIRSCEDQTRFDLAWSGTGEILSIKYTLYNSSDNSHTDGEIDGSAGFGTSAIVWGKPGDTALSVDVTLVSGEEFSYLADASLCGTSEVHERGNPAAKPVAPTAAEEDSSGAGTDAVEPTGFGELDVVLYSGHPNVKLTGIPVALMSMDSPDVLWATIDENDTAVFTDVPAGNYEINPRVDPPYDEVRVPVEITAGNLSTQAINLTHSQGSFHTFIYQPPAEVTWGNIYFNLYDAASGYDNGYYLNVNEEITLLLPAGNYEVTVTSYDADQILQFVKTYLTVSQSDSTVVIQPTVASSGTLDVYLVTSGISFIPSNIEIELLLNDQIVNTAITDSTGYARFELVEARPGYRLRVNEMGSFPTYTTEEFQVQQDIVQSQTINWQSTIQGETVIFDVNLPAVDHEMFFEFAVYDSNQNHINSYSFSESGNHQQSMELAPGVYSYYTSGDSYYQLSNVEFEVIAGETNIVTISPEVRPWKTVTFVVDLQSENQDGSFYLTTHDQDWNFYRSFTFYSAGLYYESLQLPVGNYVYSTSNGGFEWYETVSDIHLEVVENGENRIYVTPTMNPTGRVAIEVNMTAPDESQWVEVEVDSLYSYERSVLRFEGAGTYHRTLNLPIGSFSYTVTGSPYDVVRNVWFEVTEGQTTDLAITPEVTAQELVTFNIDLQSPKQNQYWTLRVVDQNGYMRGRIDLYSGGMHTTIMPLPAGSYTYETITYDYESVWDVPFEVISGGPNEITITPTPSVDPVKPTGTVTFTVDLPSIMDNQPFRVQVREQNSTYIENSVGIYESGVTVHTFELPVGDYVFDAFGSPYLGSYDNPITIEEGTDLTIALAPVHAPVETVAFEVDLPLDVENQYLQINIEDQYGNYFGYLIFRGHGPQSQTIDLPVGTYFYSLSGTPFKRVEGIRFEVKSGETNRIELSPTLLQWEVVQFNVNLEPTSGAYDYFYLSIYDEDGYSVHSLYFDGEGLHSQSLALAPGTYTYSGGGNPYLAIADTTFEVVAGGDNVVEITPVVPDYVDLTVRGTPPDGEYIYLQITNEYTGSVLYEYMYDEEFTAKLPVGDYTVTATAGYSDWTDYAAQVVPITLSSDGPNLIELAPFVLSPSITFTVVDQSSMPVEGATVRIRNEWSWQTRSVSTDDSGTARIHLEAGEYTYTVAAPIRYQQHEGGSFIHNADGDAVEITLTEIPNADLIVTFGFQSGIDRPYSAYLIDADGNELTYFNVPQKANSVLISGVPIADGYTVRVDESAWYPQQSSEPFAVTSGGTNTVLFNLSSLPLVQVNFQFTPPSGRDLPQTPSLDIAPSDQSGLYEWVYLEPDSEGVYRGSVLLPEETYEINPGWGDGGFLTMTPFTVDLDASASPVSLELNIVVADYGTVTFDLSAIESLIFPGQGDNFAISQDGVITNGAYIDWNSGTPTTYPVALKSGVYQWTLRSYGAAGGMSGEFTIENGDVTVYVEGQPADYGVVIVSTSFPAGIEPTTVSGSVRLSPASGEGPVVTRYLDDLTEVAIGPMPYGSYLVSIQSNDPRFSSDGVIEVEIASAEQHVSIEWTATGAPPIGTHEYTITLHGSSGGETPANAYIWVSTPFSPSGTAFYADANGVVHLTVTDTHLQNWYAYAYAVNYETVEVPLPNTGSADISFSSPMSRVEVAVVDELGNPLPGMRVTLSCGYRGGAVSDENGVALIYERLIENSQCAASVSDPMGGFVTPYDNVPFRWKSANDPSVVVTMQESDDAVHNVTLTISQAGAPVAEGTNIDVVSGKDGSTLQTMTDANGSLTIPSMQPGDYVVYIPLLTDNQLGWGSAGIPSQIAKSISVIEEDQQIALNVTADDYYTTTFNVVTSDGSPLPAGLTLRAALYGRGSTTYSDPISITGDPITLNLAPGYYNFEINDTGRYRGLRYQFAATEDGEVTLTLQRIGSASTSTPGISLSAASGQAGTSTTVTGARFQPGETVTLHWGDSSGPELGSATVDNEGNFSVNVTIPVTASIKSYTISAVGSVGSRSSTVYKVTQLAVVTVSLSVTSGQAGTSTTVSGSGFQPGETVTIRWDGATGDVLGTATAMQDGTFSASVDVPSTAQIGTVSIHVSGDSSSQTGSADYSVNKLVAVSLRLAIPSGRAGSANTVIGSGFQPGETVTIYWLGPAGPVLGTFEASDTGELIGRVNVPATAQLGTYNIYVRGDSSNQVGAVKYEVTSLVAVSLRLAITSGRAGSATTVIGSGFKPGETVTIYWLGPAGPVLGSFRASATGELVGRVNIPATTQLGTYNIYVRGNSSNQVGAVKYTVTHLVAVRLRLAIPSGRAGSATTVIGSGFKPGESVTIYWLGPAGPVLGTFRASATGELIGRVNIPATAQLGTFNIYVRGNSSSQIGAVKYTVNRLVAVSLRLSPSSGQAGTTTTVIGSGFKPGETVTIRWGGTVGPIIGTTRASTGGNISVRITAPKNATRTTHSIVAQGGTSKQVGVVKYTVTLLASADPIRQEYVISEFYVRS